MEYVLRLIPVSTIHQIGSLQSICYSSEFHANSNHQVTRSCYLMMKLRVVTNVLKWLDFMYGLDHFSLLCGTFSAFAVRIIDHLRCILLRSFHCREQ